MDSIPGTIEIEIMFAQNNTEETTEPFHKKRRLTLEVHDLINLSADDTATNRSVDIFNIPKDEELPRNINFFLTKSEKHDCFFVIGPKSGPKVRIGALKIFLIAISEPFRKMLDSSDLREKRDIYLTDTDKDTFINFLKCIYGSSDIVLSRISFEESAKLLYLFDKYSVTELKFKLAQDIITRLKGSKKLAFVALEHSVCMHSVLIEPELQKVVQDNVNTMVINSKFLGLPSKAVLYITKLPRLNISEIKLWNAVLDWAQFKCNSDDGEILRVCLNKHLKFIRFCSMTPVEFIFSVVPTNILSAEEVLEICKSFSSKIPPQMENVCNEICSRTEK